MRFGRWIAGVSIVVLVAGAGCGGCDSDETSDAPTQGTGASATSGGAGGDQGGGGSGAGAMDVWTAWQQIQTALRQSPDHLPAQAAQRVADGDPVAIFELVRDSIATYPPERGSLYGAEWATRWGTMGTLRGGAGTPREKCDLLVELYQGAGFEAEVYVGEADPAKLDGQKMLLRTVDRAFAPPITPEQSSTWATALGHETLKELGIIDADGSKTKALGDHLVAAVGPGQLSPFDFTLTGIPVVRVVVDGEPRWANPSAPDAPFGESFTLAEPIPAFEATPPQKVTVRLAAARADKPFDRFTLVERTYDAREVVGRRVQVGFPPPVPVETLAYMRVADVETVVPVLNVIDDGLEPGEAEALAEVGDMLTLGGDIYTQTEGGGLAVNGEPLAEVDTDPGSLAKVASIEIHPNGSAYRRVRVAVTARDADGNQVPRLGSAAFKLEEDGKPISFTLTRNEAPPPRVVILYDTSTSLPPEFLGAGAVELGNDIIGPLYAAYPDAQVRVGSVFFGAQWVAGGWATNLAEAQAQVAQLATAPGSSDLWTALFHASEEDPTVVLLVTDGDATDVPTQQFTVGIVGGPPVLSIGVGTVDQAELDEISAISGGKSVPVADISEATAAALEEIEARAAEDYILSYDAPADGAATRQVTVTANAKAGEGSYEVPADPVLPAAFSGLYLTLGIDGREHTATIAGFGDGYSTAYPELTQAMLDDVRAALMGRVSIAVEGASPTPSLVLDEWITDKLAKRPLVEAILETAETGDVAPALAALKQGFNQAPAKLSLSQPPLVDQWSTEAQTFETGPRLAALVQKVAPGGVVSRALSLFPLSQWATAAPDPAVAWERNLRATAGLAVMEAEAFEGGSTLEDLEGKSLTLLAPNEVANREGLTTQQQRAWAELTVYFGSDYRLLVPLAPGPFWAIHMPTGTVIGMGATGLGTGAEDVCNAHDQMNDILQMLSLLGSFFGVPFGGWVALGQWEEKNVTMATLVIGYGATASDITNPLIDVGCGALNDALGGGANGISRAYALYDAIAGTYNTTNPDSASMPTLCGGGSDPCH